MKIQIHDTVRKLMELHTLEDRFEAFENNVEKSTEMEGEIQALRARIPTSILQRHDRFRARGRRSVAELRNGVCTGCHMQAAIGLRSAILHQEQVYACENCGRVLYLAPQPAPQPQAEIVPPLSAADSAKPPRKKATPVAMA